MKQIPKPTNCHCKRCNRSWFSTVLAKTGMPPRACVFCKTYEWNKPRRR